SRGARLYDQPPTGRPRPSGQSHRAIVDGGGVDAGARRPRAPAGTSSLSVEKRQVDNRITTAAGRLSRILGAKRLSHAGRPLARAALWPAGSREDEERAPLTYCPMNWKNLPNTRMPL